MIRWAASPAEGASSAMPWAKSQRPAPPLAEPFQVRSSSIPSNTGRPCQRRASDFSSAASVSSDDGEEGWAQFALWQKSSGCGGVQAPPASSKHNGNSRLEARRGISKASEQAREDEVGDLAIPPDGLAGQVAAVL